VPADAPFVAPHAQFQASVPGARMGSVESAGGFWTARGKELKSTVEGKLNGMQDLHGNPL